MFYKNFFKFFFTKIFCTTFPTPIDHACKIPICLNIFSASSKDISLALGFASAKSTLLPNNAIKYSLGSPIESFILFIHFLILSKVSFLVISHTSNSPYKFL